MGKNYISTGSLYLCSALFLSLGLPEDAPFWKDDNLPWTKKRIWEGQDTPCRHAIV